MEKWRFLSIDWLTYADTAIYRPTLMRAKSENIIPDTVSFCTFTKPSMVIPYFNDPEKEINLPFLRDNNIPVHRVIGSGGPIFGDAGYEFTFLHIARNNPKVPPDAPQMFEKTLNAIAGGIAEHFNIECRFRPLNDVEVRGADGVWRKIGPSSCFYEEKGVQMGSGIQIKKPDKDLIASAIATIPEKFVDKKTVSIQERITYLEQVVGRPISFEEVRDLCKRQIEKAFDVELVTGELSEQELKYYQEMKEEYTSEEFFMERSERKFHPLPAGVSRKMLLFKVIGGPLVRIIAFIKDNTIWNLLITGAIHASPLRPTSPIHEIEKALQSIPVDKNVFEEKIREVLSRPHFNFAKVTPELLADKIYECALK